MKILLAEDEPISRAIVANLLMSWGHNVVAVENGQAAWDILQAPDAPPLAILDWIMPGMQGIELCRAIRAQGNPQPPYLILMTARLDRTSVITGLRCGANDYIRKPCDPDELRARLDIGIMVVGLQQRLAERVRDLEKALAHIKRLQGILPICSYCKKIRNDQQSWQRLENYITEHTDVLFSHGICPECFDRAIKEAKAILGRSPAPRSPVGVAQ